MCKKIVIKAPSPPHSVEEMLGHTLNVQETLLIYFVQKSSLSVVQLLTYLQY